MNGSEDFFIEDGVLIKYEGPGGDVTVPDGVTRIRAAAFEDSFVRSVSLPRGVTRIDDRAFHRSVSLLRISLPEGLLHIGDEAFSGCTSLVDVRLPEELRYLGKKAFSGCEALARVSLPKRLRHLGANAFLGCLMLTELRFSEGLRRVGDCAFYGCSGLTRLDLPESLEIVGKWAFSRCGGLTDVVLPSRVRVLDTGAFSGCKGLRTVSMPEGLARIGPMAFSYCSELRDAVLPESVTWIGEYAFRDCRGLADENGFLIHRGVLLQYFGPQGPTADPPEVIRLGRLEFRRWKEVLRVQIPDGVTSASTNAFLGARMILRVRRWFPELTRAVRLCRVLAVVTEEPSPAPPPPRLRRAFRIGCALRPESELDTEAAREDMAWLSKNAARLCADAFELPELLHFLCRRRLIRPKDADLYLAEARARKDPARIALLLDYQNDLGREAMEKAREEKRRREERAAEARAKRLAARRPEDGVAGLRFSLADGTAYAASAESLRRELELLGARLSDAVTAGTDYLVAKGSAAEPGTAARAEALGIPLITEEDLLAWLDALEGDGEAQ